MDKTRFIAASAVLAALHILFVLWLAKNGIRHIFIVKFHAVFPALFVVAFIKRMEYGGSFGSNRVRILVLMVILSSFASVFYLPLFPLVLLSYAFSVHCGINVCDDER
jgi:hypothetical protein